MFLLITVGELHPLIVLFPSLLHDSFIVHTPFSQSIPSCKLFFLLIFVVDFVHLCIEMSLVLSLMFGPFFNVFKRVEMYEF